MLDLYLHLASILGVCVVILWGISLISGKVSFVDGFWGGGFVLLGWASFYWQLGLQEDPAPHILVSFIQLPLHAQLTLGGVTLWGTRLGSQMLIRFFSEGEDNRYKALLAGIKMPKPLFTLVFVFFMQAFFMAITALPVTLSVGLSSNTPDLPLDALRFVLGGALFLFGFIFESVADHQLAAFKEKEDNAGKVMDQGLWAWSRHPNYFGEICVWWGLWLISGHMLAILSPLFITFTLLRWSGIPILEGGITERRPDYARYREQVSALIPKRPKH